MGSGEDARFVAEELLPEMVHNRCFCEAGSREFVELDSVEVEPAELGAGLGRALYRARLVVLFSGEPEQFRVLVKLLPADESGAGPAYDGFLNEEILCNKAAAHLAPHHLPRFYVADMGRYGRPVVVVEDLERAGFRRVLDRRLDEREAGLVVRLVAGLHAKAAQLRADSFPVFRELYAKFQEIAFAESREQQTRHRLSRLLESVRSQGMAKEKLDRLEQLLGEDAYSACKAASAPKDGCGLQDTICQGLLVRENLWFRGDDEVRVLDWQRVRRGPASLDLATLLAECQTDRWDDLVLAYAEALPPEHRDVDRLKSELARGLPYALLTLGLARPEPAELTSFLGYVLE